MHYRGEDLIILPDDPELATFRHQWVLERNVRPMVPSPSKTPLPSKYHDSEDAARLLSVYLRPWVLSHRHACDHVPHLCQLSAFEESTRYLRKQPRKLPEYSFYKAFTWYNDGHIVSEHARHCIQGFLSMCIARGCASRDRDTVEGGEGPVPEDRLLDRSLGLVHRVLRSTFLGEEPEAKAHAKQPKSISDAIRHRHWNAVRLGRAMWQTEDVPSSAVGVGSFDASGTRATPDTKAFFKTALKMKKPSDDDKLMPFVGSNAPVAGLYTKLPRSGECPLQKWLLDLQNSAEPPKAEQVPILECVIQRLKYECLQERRDLQAQRKKALRQPLGVSRKRAREVEPEPISALIHGLPGTGKSEVLRYIRSLFEDVLGWEHGNQFVFLAVQNTAAAEVGGNTIHSWGASPSARLTSLSCERQVEGNRMFPRSSCDARICVLYLSMRSVWWRQSSWQTSNPPSDGQCGLQTHTRNEGTAHIDFSEV